MGFVAIYGLHESGLGEITQLFLLIADEIEEDNNWQCIRKKNLL